MNTRKEIIQNRLKEYRLKVGLTQKQVATALGFVTEERISSWEKGSNIPSLKNLLKFSIVYHASIKDFYPNLMENVRQEIKERFEKIKYSDSKPKFNKVN